MSAIAYNLKKLLKWESRKIKVMAVANLPGRQAGRKEVKNTLCNLFFYPCFLPCGSGYHYNIEKTNPDVQKIIAGK